VRNYLIRAREARGLTQQGVADKIGLSRQCYQAIETGKRQADLKTSMIPKLSAAFGVSASEIYRLEAEYQEERAAVLAKQGLATDNRP